jgi:hypothetical protein
MTDQAAPVADGRDAGPTDNLTTRRHMSARQQATVQSLLDAAEGVLRDRGYDELTLRLVSTEAGVTHTTAYTYFSSKAHLVSEVFWRRLRQIPHPTHTPGASLPERVDAALREPGLALSDEPELAQGALAALLTSDPASDSTSQPGWGSPSGTTWTPGSPKRCYSPSAAPCSRREWATSTSTAWSAA